MVAPTPRIDIPEQALAEFCERWDVVEFGLFGSVLCDDFGPDSDVDVLERSIVQRDPDWIRRRAILGGSRVIYDAR